MSQIIALLGSQQGITIQVSDPVYTDSLMQLLNNLSQIGLFVLIFLVMGIVVQEKERGTAAFLLVKPVSRSAFIMAKFIMLLGVTAVLMLIALLVCGVYTGILFGVFPWGSLAGLCGTLFLYITIILSFSLLMSTLAPSQAVAGILSLGGWILISLLSQWGGAGKFLAGSLLQESQGIIYGMTPQWHPYAGGVICIIGAVTGAAAVFRRWEA
jgi:ABC-2 type transport system permease protein